MNQKVKKIVYHFSKGQLRGILYNKLRIDWIPRLFGKLSLLCYGALYQHIKLGKNIRCWGHIVLTKSPESMIKIGDQVRIVSDYTRASIALYGRCKLQVFFKSRLTIGDRVGLNGTAITCRTTAVEIGNDTIVAPNVIIVDSDFHAAWPPENRMYNMGYEQDRPVKIGKKVWIGMNTLVLKGVTIGDNTIIAAGSVVVQDVPANVMAGGTPARVLKHLGSDE